VFDALAYRLTGLMNRWSNAAPTACCGACKPCVTEAATNLVVVAAGVGIEAASAKREAHRARSSPGDASAEPLAR
jgi:hypothetical protein